jgi:2,4-dienoyl-CoA reductase-like NADH-dependent reductase (Old Yellow Enzyme family)
LARAGIDGIELHGHEGYLFEQFTTAIWNKKTDKYGGDLAGRLRLPIEVLNEIKQKVGKDLPVQYRFGLKHYIKGLNMGPFQVKTIQRPAGISKKALKWRKCLRKLVSIISFFWPVFPGIAVSSFPPICLGKDKSPQSWLRVRPLRVP